MDQVQKPSLGAARLWFTRVAPFFLPAFLFQSAIFAFVSPLPIFILTLKNRLWVSMLALAANIAITYATAPHEDALIIAVFWFAIGVLFPFLIRNSSRIHLSFFLSFMYMVGMILMGLYLLSHELGINMIEYVRSEISSGMDRLIALPDSPVKEIVKEQGRDALFRQLMTELPSGTLIALLLSLWVNLLFASSMVKGFLSKTFWSSYRNPEWLVWATLASAAAYIWGEHAVYYIGLNALKVLLVFYGFQGLSVMSHLLNRYKIVGFGRAILVFFAVFVAMPLVLSLGFFDLWFDFRKKFVQS